MTAPTDELLAASLGEILEEAAFIFTEPLDAPPPFEGQALEARIGYQGPHTGELRLVADAGLAATLAANLLGEDEGEATRGKAGEAVGELLNMFVGVWVVKLFGQQSRCKLGVPRVRELPAAEAGTRPRDAACAASLVEEEGRRIDVSLTLAGGG